MCIKREVHGPRGSELIMAESNLLRKKRVQIFLQYNFSKFLLVGTFPIHAAADMDD